MAWFLVPKKPGFQPAGRYTDWKGLLSEEARHQCVYCTITEPQFGGIRNFHVEHYRPKKKFADLEHRFSNLYYACGICNTFKGDDWPSEPSDDHSNKSYPDPSRVDYGTIFAVSDANVVSGNCIAASYMVERLNLNRPQLVVSRATRRVMSEIVDLLDVVQRLAVKVGSVDAEVVSAVVEAAKLLEAASRAVGYGSADVRR